MPTAWTQLQASADHNAVFSGSPTAHTWTFPTGGLIVSGLSLVGHVLYVESLDHDLYAVDGATGSLRWMHPTEGEDMPAPALVDGRLVFANGNDVVRALSLRSGATRWRVPIRGVATMASAAAKGTTVFMVAGQSPVSTLVPPVVTFAVDALTGRILWQAPYGDADCSPTLGDGLVFVESSETLKGVKGPDTAVP